jgi:hypothetical protein
MTNDQFLMTNDGGRAQRAVKDLQKSRVRHWSLAIGIWSFSGLFTNMFVNNPG